MRTTPIPGQSSRRYEGKRYTVVSSQALDDAGKGTIANGDPELRALMDRLTYGGSFIIGPSGAFVSDVIRDNKEGIIYAACDIAFEIPMKCIHDVSGSYQRNDVYLFGLNKQRLEPVSMTNTDAAEGSLDFYPWQESDA